MNTWTKLGIGAAALLLGTATCGALGPDAGRPVEVGDHLQGVLVEGQPLMSTAGGFVVGELDGSWMQLLVLPDRNGERWINLDHVVALVPAPEE